MNTYLRKYMNTLIQTLENLLKGEGGYDELSGL